MKLRRALSLTARLGLAVGVIGLNGACQMSANANGGWQVQHFDRQEIYNPQFNQAQFGTFDPRQTRTGTTDPAQVAAEKIAAAASASYESRWITQVRRTNNLARQGLGGVLAIGLDARDPRAGASELVTQYNRLSGLVQQGNAGQRNGAIVDITQAYEGTLRARQNTAMLLHRAPTLDNMLQYVELELARRVLGKVLTDAGVKYTSEIRQDYAPTFGMANGSAVAMAAVKEGRFQVDEELLLNDRAQRGSLTSVGRVEERAMAGIARYLAPEMALFERAQVRAADTGRTVTDVRLPREIGQPRY